MKKWEKFSKEDLERLVNESQSYNQLGQQMGYSSNGGRATQAAKEVIEIYQFDISHFKGQSWNKNNFDYKRFKYGNNIKSAKMLLALIHLRGHHCEQCGLAFWLDKPITLEVHHLDGDHLNTELDNLILLCPNCHSYTDSWRKPKEKTIIEECDFVNALQTKPNIRQALLSLGLSAKGANYERARTLIHKYNIQHLL